MAYTALELRTALRQEASTLKSKNGTSNIRFTLQFKNGTSKTCKLNPDGTWVFKPTEWAIEQNGEEKFVRFEWIDVQNRVKSDDGTTVTYSDMYYTEIIDPTEVIGFEFYGDYETTSQRTIPTDNE